MAKLLRKTKPVPVAIPAKRSRWRAIQARSRARAAEVSAANADTAVRHLELPVFPLSKRQAKLAARKGDRRYHRGHGRPNGHPRSVFS